MSGLVGTQIVCFLMHRLILIFVAMPRIQQKMSLCVTKPTIWVPTMSDTNQPVQSQKIARSLKFGMNEEEKLYYPYSENKGADQLRSYCEADLRLCFRLCILLVFPCSGSNNSVFAFEVNF